MDERDIIKQKLCTYNRLRKMRIDGELVHKLHYDHDQYGNRKYTDEGVQVIIKDRPKVGRPKKIK